MLKKLLKFLHPFAKYAFVGYFIVVIFAYFGASFAQDKYEALSDNRMPAKFPRQITTNFPKEFENYYQDNFPNRKKLIKRYNKTRRKKFAINDYVIIGEDDWLFYNSVRSEVKSDQLADFMGTNLYTPDFLEQIINHFMDDVENFKAMGAKLFVTFTPNKMTIYYDKMPENYRKSRALYTRTDQLEDALKAKGINVVDYKDLLLAAKKDDLLYLRTDTHWNSYGGYLAYRRLFNEMQEQGAIPSSEKPVNVIAKKPYPFRCGDNYKTMDANFPCEDIQIDLTFEKEPQAKCAREGKHQDVNLGEDMIRCITPGKKKKLLVIRDSFFNSIYPQLSEHFGTTVLLWRNLMPYSEMEQVINAEKPDVVVLEYLERFSYHVGDTIFLD